MKKYTKQQLETELYGLYKGEDINEVDAEITKKYGAVYVDEDYDDAVYDEDDEDYDYDEDDEEYEGYYTYLIKRTYTFGKFTVRFTYGQDDGEITDIYVY